MAARNPISRPLQINTIQTQTAPNCKRVFMGDNATVHIEYYICSDVPDTVPKYYGLYMRLHRRLQHIHVCVWRDQIVLIA